MTLRPHTYANLTPAQLTPRRIAELSGRELDAQIAWHILQRPFTPDAPRWHSDIRQASALCRSCGIDFSSMPPIAAVLSRACLRQHLRRQWPQLPHWSTADAA